MTGSKSGSGSGTESGTYVTRPTNLQNKKQFFSSNFKNLKVHLYLLKHKQTKNKELQS